MSKSAHIIGTKPDHEETYDEWFRFEVGKTLDGLKDGSVGVISEEEHDRCWREKRAALLAASAKPE